QVRRSVIYDNDLKISRPGLGLHRVQAFYDALFRVVHGNNYRNHHVNVRISCLKYGVALILFVIRNTVLYGPPKRNLIRILQFIADRYSAGYGREINFEMFELFVDIISGGISLHCRAQSEDKFFYRSGLQFALNSRNVQLVRTDPFHRRNLTAENEISSTVLPCVFYRQYIAYIFHNAEHLVVSLRIGADFTYFRIRKIMAVAAVLNVGNQLLQGLTKYHSLAFRLPEQMKCKPEG